MSFTRTLSSPWTWAALLTLIHLATTAVLLQALESLVVLNHITATLRPAGGATLQRFEPPRSVHELLLTALTLSHLPIMAASEWWPPSWPWKLPSLFWLAFGLDSTIQSCTAVVIARSLARPSRLLRRFRIPFLSRRVMLLGFSLAATHLAASAALIAAGRFGATPAYQSDGLLPTIVSAFQVLQPMVGRGVMRPYGLTDPENIGFLLLGSLTWGFASMLLLRLVQRNFFHQSQEVHTANRVTRPSPLPRPTGGIQG